MSSSSVAPAPLSERVRRTFGRYVGGDKALRLNLGSALNHEPGFSNLDFDPRTSPDVLHDLETVPLPFADATWDCILGSHVFEHIVHLIPLVNDLYRVLTPGGYLIAVTPYVSSDDAWDSPHHVRAFSENTWHYFSRALYERTSLEHAGLGAMQGFTYPAWQIVETTLVPYPEYAAAAASDLEFAKRHYRNVIQEIHVVLQKPGG